MTDVYISYAREDHERVRPLAETLQFEGWDVWWDPSQPDGDSRAALDQKLGSAGAILVVWSAYSRGSEYVRSEAATGLYKNKLIQTRIDSASPPRPFDQVEVVDLSLWSGERDDPSWRRVVQAVRLFAGAPGSRPIAPRQPARKKQPLLGEKPEYIERDRSVALAPIIAAGVLVLAGAGVWFVDPFSWRGAKAKEALEAAVATSATDALAADGEAILAGEFVDTEESEAGWAQVDRNEPETLRTHIKAFPRSSTADTARSLLRVLDAQAWVDAVTADNEIAYSSYLKDFPDDGPAPGLMAASARERLASLSTERTQAIEEIQRGLQALELYTGKVDGKGGSTTIAAMRQFASLKRKPAPMLSSAAPRDLRSFSDLIQKQAIAEGKTIAPPAQTQFAASPAPAPAKAAPSQPIIAAATSVNPPAPRANAPTANAPAAAVPSTNIASQPRTATEIAEAADRQRREAAQAAAASAKKEVLPAGAEDLAAGELKRSGEQLAWEKAENTGTAAAYQSYLASFPAGSRVADAKAAVSRLGRTTGFSLDQISGEVKLAAEAARRAQTTANSRAAAARGTASQATSAAGIRSIVAADGDRYETQISGGAPNGLGLRINGDARTLGDRYRGEIRNGQSSGLGVYEFADNPGNARSGILRYEGEHAGDRTSGYGVTYWKNGDTFAGLESGDTGAARGVLTFSNGQRYEGEMRNGVRNGVGVVWSSDGQVMMAGRWENGQLVQPMAQ